MQANRYLRHCWDAYNGQGIFERRDYLIVRAADEGSTKADGFENRPFFKARALKIDPLRL
jgi:hypothetical protein